MHHSSSGPAPHNGALALLALSLGSFCIGTTEFASMGILPLVVQDLGVTIPQAGHAVSAYAVGVVTGAPLLTMAGARLHRRPFLLMLFAMFIIGNVLSALAPSIDTLILARFLTGLPHGCYFGAGVVAGAHLVGKSKTGRAVSLILLGLTVANIIGAPAATFAGQVLGWRNTYLLVALCGVIALGCLWRWLPRADALKGNPVQQELHGLRTPRAWFLLLIIAIGTSSIFAVYTYIGPMVTDIALLPAGMIPIALMTFGAGMTSGNLLGGYLADKYQQKGIVIGFCCVLAVLVIMGLTAGSSWMLLLCLFAIAFSSMLVVPSMQVQIMLSAPQAPTLMGALTHAAFNAANALGAWLGGVTIAAGLGLVSPVWAGLAMTAVGLLIFLVGTALLHKARRRA